MYAYSNKYVCMHAYSYICTCTGIYNMHACTYVYEFVMYVCTFINTYVHCVNQLVIGHHSFSNQIQANSVCKDKGHHKCSKGKQ